MNALKNRSNGHYFFSPAAAMLIAVSILLWPSCTGREKDEPGRGLSIMANAVRGGVNSQVAEWLLEELPSIEEELGVDVKFLSAGLADKDYKARIALDIKSGRGADVIALDQFWVPEFAGAKFILPLDGYVRSWPAWEEYFEPIREMGSFNGRAYQVVWNADVRMIFYNRGIFKRAGIETPWQPESWEDLVRAGRAIKECCPGVIPFQVNAGTAMGEATTMQGFFMILLGTGGRLYDYERGCWVADGPGLRSALEFYRLLYIKEGLCDPDLQISAKAREKTFTLFSQGRIAAYIESTWFYSSVLSPSNKSWGMAARDEKIGWAKMPGRGKPGDPPYVSISGGDGLVINPAAKDPDLAWRLVAQLNELARQERLFMKKPFTPVRKDLASLPSVEEQELIAKTAAEIMPYTSFRPALPVYPEISFHVQYLTERVVTGRLGVDEAIKEFGRAVENLVGQDLVCGF